MPDWLVIWLPVLSQTLFVFAFGACAGSLANVLVYRMPLGLDVVAPSSRCPSCDTKLTWRENIPILGWLLLRGKCRFCKSPISAEYPAVETVVAVLFAGLFLLWYHTPADFSLLGVSVGTIAPEWAGNGAVRTWPAFVVLVFMVGALVPITLIDARTFTIPLTLTWAPALVALVLHTGHALWWELSHGGPELILPGGGWRPAEGARWLSAEGAVWTLPTPGVTGWPWIGLAFGGMVGIGVSLLAMRLGLITRSFADYDEWEAQATADAEAEAKAAGHDAGDDESPADLWIQYPHARREMVRELAFCAPPALLGIAGFWLAERFGPAMPGWPPATTSGIWLVPDGAPPLWLLVLSGVLLGYLIGGAVVWAVRIFGSLLFGKEAMGMGDVHLMAAVGACIGWVDATLAFFGAAFVGVAYALGSALLNKGTPRAMPYGPFLAIATVLIIVGKPLVEWVLSRLTGGPVDLI